MSTRDAHQPSARSDRLDAAFNDLARVTGDAADELRPDELAEYVTELREIAANLARWLAEHQD